MTYRDVRKKKIIKAYYFMNGKNKEQTNMDIENYRRFFEKEPWERNSICDEVVLHACYVTSVTSDSARPYGLQPIRLLCPWDSPGKNIGVAGHTLLQGIFPTQGSNPHLLS